MSTVLLDTGSGTTLLTPATARGLGVEGPADPIEIVYAGGERAFSNRGVEFGGERAHIVPGLQDNLFSPAHMLDDGYTLHLDASGGTIENMDKSIVLPIHRDRDSWRLWVNDLILLPHDPGKTYTANAMYTGSFLQSTSDTLSKREELAMAEQTNALLSAVPSTTGTTCTIIHPLQKLVAAAKLRIYGDSARIYIIVVYMRKWVTLLLSK